VDSGHGLKPPDQRAEFSLIFIVLLWWFLAHARKVFDEIWVEQ
jgi:hypothetical protein